MKSVLKDLSFQFGLDVIMAYRVLVSEKREFILGRQFLRSGTAVGALVREAEFGQSRADFVSKLSIALKEANETHYWIELMKASNLMNRERAEHLEGKINQLIRILVASIKTAKSNSQH